MASASQSDSSLHLISSHDQSRNAASDHSKADDQVRGSMLSLVTRRESFAPEAEHADLSAILHRLFDREHDRIFCDVPSRAQAVNEADQHLRVDPPHTVDHMLHARENGDSKIRLFSALGAANAQVHLHRQSWVIAVVHDWTALSEEVIDQVRQLNEAGAQLLLIVCDEAGPNTRPSRRWTDVTTLRMMRVAEQSNVQYVGPLFGAQSEVLNERLAAVKRSCQATLLHLILQDSSRSTKSPHSEASQTTLKSLGAGDCVLTRASEELATCAQEDERILALSVPRLPDLSAAWRQTPRRFFHATSDLRHALSWCFGAASVGCRPFVFLTLDDLQEHLGYIRRELAAKQFAVTFIVCSTAETSDKHLGHALASLRLLETTPIALPRSIRELSRMIDWSVQQDGPVVIWLDQAIRVSSDSSQRSDVELGRSEQMQGGQVALISWGVGVAATCQAADQLAALGVQAVVRDLSFANPLDTLGILESARQASCVVIVDYLPQLGITGQVLELLAGAGVTAPISVVSANETMLAASGRGQQAPLVQRIVERCRWLGDPAKTDMPTVSGSADCTDKEDSAGLDGWIYLFTSHDEAAEREHHTILEKQFSPTIDGWLNNYRAVGKRDLYLWRWCMHGVEITTLPCVPNEWHHDLCESKFLAAMLNVLIDDVADQHYSSELLNELLSLVRGGKPDFHRLPDDQRKYGQFTEQLWSEFWKRVARYPQFPAFEELLKYDMLQLFNTVHYSQLVNQNLCLLNRSEHELYSPQGMMITVFGTIDLMCSTAFQIDELGRLRDALWHAQWMARIGNLITTWQRELPDHDYSSGVFAEAVSRGDLTIGQLEAGDIGTISSAIRDGQYEQRFLQKWEYHRQCLQAMKPHIRSFDLDVIVESQVRLLQTELGSRGWK